MPSESWLACAIWGLRDSPTSLLSCSASRGRVIAACGPAPGQAFGASRWRTAFGRYIQGPILPRQYLTAPSTSWVIVDGYVYRCGRDLCGRHFAVRTRLVAAFGLVSILVFYLVSVTVFSQPDMSEHQGWVEVLQPLGEVQDGQQLLLRAGASSPGAPGEHPEIRYSVVVCGGQRFRGVLLLGGDARLGDASAVDPRNSPVRVEQFTNLAIGPPGRPVSLGPVQFVQLNVEQPLECSSEGSTEVGQFFAGSPTEVSGLALGPIQRTSRIGWWSGPHSGQAWPVVGGVPGLPPGLLGEYEATEGLSGSWQRLPSQRNVVTGGGLTGQAAIGFARPALTDPSELAWESSVEPLHPIAQVSDLDALNAWQQAQVAAGIGLGIGGSLLAGLLLTGDRPRPSVQPEPHMPDAITRNVSGSTDEKVRFLVRLALLLIAVATVARFSWRAP